MWCKITNIGKNAGMNQHKLISGAMQSHSSGETQYKGLRKDHKTPDPEFGPPLRVLADGSKGPKAPTANLISHVLRPVKNNLNEKI